MEIEEEQMIRNTIKEKIHSLLRQSPIPLTKSAFQNNLDLSFYYVDRAIKDLINEGKARPVQVSPTRWAYVAIR